MDKEVSIVLSVERKNHRKLAQEWYGLTDEQMKGMGVHHNPPRHKGGRNIPEHLFVYHNTLHSAVHEDTFVLWARKGAEVSNKKLHAEKDELGRSKVAVKAGKSTHKEKDEFGRSIRGVEGAKMLHAEKDEFGRSVNAMKIHLQKDEFGRSVVGVKFAENTNAQRWEDPDHPELGIYSPGTLARIQKSKGLPHGPENRRRVQ